jgi:hypothetical protein
MSGLSRSELRQMEQVPTTFLESHCAPKHPRPVSNRLLHRQELGRWAGAGAGAQLLPSRSHTCPSIAPLNTVVRVSLVLCSWCYSALSPVSVGTQIKAAEAKEAAKNKPVDAPKSQSSVAKKTTPAKPAAAPTPAPRATTGGKTMGAKGRAGVHLHVCASRKGTNRREDGRESTR